jgi:AraC family transcriptional regulator
MRALTYPEGPTASRYANAAEAIKTAVGDGSRDDDSVSEILARLEDIRAVVRHELRARGLSESVSTEQIVILVTTSLLDDHPLNAEIVHQPCYAPGPDTMPRVLEFIEEHLTDNLSLERISTVASFSPFHFARVFRTAMGVSPHQYIIGRRVERARFLLRTTNWTLAAIAREVGFASGSHLALHFKRVLGESPRHYRRRSATEESA